MAFKKANNQQPNFQRSPKQYEADYRGTNHGDFKKNQRFPDFPLRITGKKSGLLGNEAMQRKSLGLSFHTAFFHIIAILLDWVVGRLCVYCRLGEIFFLLAAIKLLSFSLVEIIAEHSFF